MNYIVEKIASEVALPSNSGNADQDLTPLTHAVENAVKNGYNTLRSEVLKQNIRLLDQVDQLAKALLRTSPPCLTLTTSSFSTQGSSKKRASLGRRRLPPYYTIYKPPLRTTPARSHRTRTGPAVPGRYIPHGTLGEHSVCLRSSSVCAAVESCANI
eukprot:3772109-Prymnesium_polylepis.1